MQTLRPSPLDFGERNGFADRPFQRPVVGRGEKVPLIPHPLARLERTGVVVKKARSMVSSCNQPLIASGRRSFTLGGSGRTVPASGAESAIAIELGATKALGGRRKRTLLGDGDDLAPWLDVHRVDARLEFARPHP